MTNWDYYESAQRFQRILEAQGISDALKEAGAKEGDLVMIGQCNLFVATAVLSSCFPLCISGEWDFDYVEKTTRWVSELGLDGIKPRRRSPTYND